MKTYCVCEITTGDISITSDFFLYKYLQDHTTLSLGRVSETIFFFLSKFQII